MFGLTYFQLALAGGAGLLVLAFLRPYLVSGVKRVLPVRKAKDDIPDLIAAARLAQSKGCQKGVDAFVELVEARLKVQ